MLRDLHIPTATGVLIIPQRDLSWSAARASGPGGQNVNRVASKVDLRFDLRGNATLPDLIKQRLLDRYGSRIDVEGRLVVVSQSARTQLANLKFARDKLAALVASASQVPKRRRPTRPTRGSVRRRLDAKRRHAEKKAKRRTSALED